MKKVIPIIIQPTTENYFWVKNVIEGIISSACRYGCELHIIDMETIKEKNLPKDVPVLVNGHLSEWLSNTARFLLANGYMPIIVNAGQTNQRQCKCSAVCFDLVSGIRDVVEYCISCGRENVVFFGGRQDVSADMEKAQLFRMSTEERGISDFKVVYMEDTPEVCIQEFVHLVIDNEIDAVFCANDTVAILLIQGLQQNSVRVPGDVLVVGLGDSMVGRLMDVPLLSLSADYIEMGKQAFRLWRYLCKDGLDANITVSVACQLKGAEKMVAFESVRNYQDCIQIEGSGGDSGWNDYFYEDEKVKRMHRLEKLLRGCDEIDLSLLKAIKCGKADEMIAAEIWMTPRAVRYRINKMMKKIDVQNRSEIMELLYEFDIMGENR